MDELKYIISKQFENKTITVTNGEANIVSSGGAYLRYNSASNQLRFRYYKSATYDSQKAISLYKLVDGSSYVTEATNWVTNFLNSITCNNGKTAPSTSNWNTQATLYNLLTNQAKNILITATYTNDNVGKAVKRYDYIVNKYGLTKYAAFINRNNVNSNHIFDNKSNNIDTNAFIGIFTISTLSIAFVYLVRRRKYN